MSIIFDLERTNQLNPLPDKDLVDLCPPIEPYQVTKSPEIQSLKIQDNSSMIQKISDNAKGWQTKVEGGTRISHKLSWEADLDAENCGYL
ncbi:hypothetical protein [Microcystis aeruginosa]|uniref:Uncharacterized protein n=1 Tax=Microcystis aeruginosa NIES-4285 TaxID=2497681 RepID=A0A402DLF5_MICAE|nr:hypothetical protein [Microcystis aeruginosa]GCE62999.1 hypothetical protein MiAbB_04954 [Microcystis aeruginosa NIES-4285]